MDIEIRPFEPSDHDEALSLWQATEGVTLRDVDSREAIERYLARNPGMSFVAREPSRLVGACLCGHDGRRGYLQHAAVVPDRRGRGIGRMLAERCRQALAAEGIFKVHLFVHSGNQDARDFWTHIGWAERGDLIMMSKGV
jgi:ribosomal protein S18 acetylase RimI-like enzyme